MRKKILLALAAGAVVATAGVAANYPVIKYPAIAPITPLPAAEAAKRKAWDYKLTAIDGAPMPMSKYKGKVVLLVNTASFCGFTPQYEALQKTANEYAARGLVVVGVPSGDFKGQEYGSNKEIAGFCSAKGIKFPLAEKSEVVGPNAIPLYRWTAAKAPADKQVQWNFHKFIIGRDGDLVASFPSVVPPTDADLRATIESALAAPAKGAKKG